MVQHSKYIFLYVYCTNPNTLRVSWEIGDIFAVSSDIEHIA